MEAGTAVWSKISKGFGKGNKSVSFLLPSQYGSRIPVKFDNLSFPFPFPFPATSLLSSQTSPGIRMRREILGCGCQRSGGIDQL